MKISIKARKWAIFVAVALLIVVLFSAFSHTHWEDSPIAKEYESYRAIKPGMTESQVRSLLGEPYKVFMKGAPDKYYVEGWSYKKRPIISKVFIYLSGEPIAYIYFDEQNKVEETFVGGS